MLPAGVWFASLDWFLSTSPCKGGYNLNTSHRCYLTVTLLLFFSNFQSSSAQTPRLGVRSAIVVDERLAVLRSAPQFSAALIRRIGRGRIVTVLETKRSRNGVVFQRVAITRRTRGWMQRDALVSPHRGGDDTRLLRLINASQNFDRLARARIFLDVFPRSRLRPAVLLIFGDEAEKTAVKLTQEARRRLDPKEMAATEAPLASYFFNYRGLDRYRRQGIVFTFDETTLEYRYDGAAWHELLRKHRESEEAGIVRSRKKNSQQ